jgi:hypothetical protein
MAGHDAPRLYCSEADRDGDWNAAALDTDVGTKREQPGATCSENG